MIENRQLEEIVKDIIRAHDSNSPALEKLITEAETVMLGYDRTIYVG